jgi:hypothetical protein
MAGQARSSIYPLQISYCRLVAIQASILLALLDQKKGKYNEHSIIIFGSMLF